MLRIDIAVSAHTMVPPNHLTHGPPLVRTQLIASCCRALLRLLVAHRTTARYCSALRTYHVLVTRAFIIRCVYSALSAQPGHRLKTVAVTEASSGKSSILNRPAGGRWRESAASGGALRVTETERYVACRTQRIRVHAIQAFNRSTYE